MSLWVWNFKWFYNQNFITKDFITKVSKNSNNLSNNHKLDEATITFIEHLKKLEQYLTINNNIYLNLIQYKTIKLNNYRLLK